MDDKKNNSGSSITDEACDALYQVFDPEVGLDIMTMGLVYNVEYKEKENLISVTMTLTTPSCPVGPMITTNVEEVLKSKFPEIKNSIDLIWEPPWSTDMISEEGKRQLGWT